MLRSLDPIPGVYCAPQVLGLASISINSVLQDQAPTLLLSRNSLVITVVYVYNIDSNTRFMHRMACTPSPYAGHVYAGHPVLFVFNTESYEDATNSVCRELAISVRI